MRVRRSLAGASATALAEWGSTTEQRSWSGAEGGHSQDIIVATFGQKGRQHRSRDNTPAILDEIASRYRLAAQSCQASTHSDIESVKKHYQTGIRAARNGEK
ncbi:hypothetical protein [Enterobacter sp. RD4-1-1]|uniref:hypothetical protein n=1 Tax=Enterobacter sp. RD4-1-1 TaxID=2986135 RepID=UPI0021E932B7|nr:hypothetical protein [Enterobacter sp. RD4-1-1]MCV3773753.1 hypothetical protein [Enterobacter sp. RD4-1-1]